MSIQPGPECSAVGCPFEGNCILDPKVPAQIIADIARENGMQGQLIRCPRSPNYDLEGTLEEIRTQENAQQPE
ncbi:hypothetical protein JW978_00730 [Candidatus Dojkabacteria bacterium]|nr:hypothetical protein [Candidatus Dojkabacteria bacterium]